MPRDIDGLIDRIDELVDWQLTQHEGTSTPPRPISAATTSTSEVLIRPYLSPQPDPDAPWMPFDANGNIDRARLESEGWQWQA
jgi:hypothetical protein